MAGRASLAFIGPEEISLSGEPEVTYFIEKYKGQTLFSSRIETVQFNENGAQFGTVKRLTLPRSGDLITDMFLRVNFPQTSSNVLDSVGTLMFQYVELYIGSELVERLWGEYIEIKFDLEIPQAKQPGLSNLIGKNLTFSSRPNAVYTIPLPFSLFKKGLPLCAFREDISIRIAWNPSFIFTSPAVNIHELFESNLNIEYTYISDQEIDFIRKSHIHMFEQVQVAQFFSTSNIFSRNLEFYNPIKEMYVVIQNQAALGYDYSLSANGTPTLGTGDMLSNLELKFNGVERIYQNVGSPIFLRIIQPLEFHTRIPDRWFYTYSFCLDPEWEIPTGAINFSRILNQNIKLLMNQTNANIRIYMKGYNFLDLSGDSARQVFSNYF
jgi:hypothetical protein